MEKTLKNKKGITLIALVVTIAILLILAGITINAIIGEGGLINRAKLAENKTTQGAENDRTEINNLTNQAERLINGNNEEGGQKTLAGTTVEKPSEWTSTKVTPIADGNGGTVPLPRGFYYIGGDYNTGLVISDKQEDTMDASGINMGNQFVWIPVPNAETLTRTFFMYDSEMGELMSEDNYSAFLPPEMADMTWEDIMNFVMQNFQNFTEPYAQGYEGEEEEYNTMRSQVLKYGGFYIGRYEAGVNSTQPREGNTVVQVVSKKGVHPYNYVKWGEAMNDIGTNGAVYLAKNMYSNHESVTSTLVYGCQWDAMSKYIANESKADRGGGNNPGLTGSNSYDVSKNIYDLAGLNPEWTMEAVIEGENAGRVIRSDWEFEELSIGTITQRNARIASSRRRRL